MTSREYFQNVLNANISDEMNQMSQTLIQRLDAKNAKRKTTQTKDQKAAAERRDMVLKFLQTHEGVFTRDEITAEIGIEPTKVTGACGVLFKGGLIQASEVKVGKSRKVAYSIA